MFPRHPERLRSFSYTGLHRYFLTFCTNSRRPLFISKRVVDAAWSQILRAAQDCAFTVIAYCFMPDHLHLLIQAELECADCKRFIARAKQFSGYQHSQQFGGRLWQRYGFEHVLRDDEDSRAVT